MFYTIVHLSTVIVLFLIALTHYYWVLKPDAEPSSKVIPYIEGVPAFHASKLGTFLVASALLLVTLFVMELGAGIIGLLPTYILKIGGTLLAAVFIVRTIGDFRLVGFTKKIKDSTFAYYDTRYWSPLCALIGLSLFYITWGS